LMPMSPAAVLDACVLYPAQLRDLLVELAARAVFQGRWTSEIHDEWMRNLQVDRPDLDPKRLQRTRERMDLNVQDSVVTGHLFLIPHLTLPDPDDRHVLAAAIVGRAEVIVTFNLKDFPRSVLAGYDIEALHPDPFLLDLLEDQREEFCSAVKTIRQRLKTPPKTVEEHLLTLEQQGLTQTVARLREFVDLI
jgi:predicted nucleic acid-binding protein